MNKVCLAKIVAVNGDLDLGAELSDHYFDKINLYLFYSECYFYPNEGRFFQTRMFHESILSKYNLFSIGDCDINFLSVDLIHDGSGKTKLVYNKRMLPLEDYQKSFIEDLFEVSRRCA